CSNQVRREGGKSLDPSFGTPELQANVLAVDVAEAAELLHEGVEETWIRRDQDANPRELSRRLRLDSERRGEHCSQASYEDTAIHLFNDLARAQQHRRWDREPERTSYGHYAATTVCRLSTAEIFRQPSIRRNLIWPLATRLKSRTSAASSLGSEPW